MKRIIAIIAILIILMASLVSCGTTGGDSGEEGDFLSVIYEGFSAQTGSYQKMDGSESESRVYCFVIENTSDKEIRKATAVISGLDENGEPMSNPQNVPVAVPYLRPGEKAFTAVFESEWKELPSGYKVEFKDVSWGKSKGQPLSVSSVKYDEGGFVCDVTLKNEGDEEFVWYYDESDLTVENMRLPSLIAVAKDADGNVQTIDTGIPVDGSDLLRENITFAPGEEREVSISFTDSHNEPEILICWR